VVRARRNLTLAADTTVERLLIQQGRTVGVEVRRGGQRRRIAAREVVAACGGIWSPALLLRSGVGPGAELRALGIEVACDLPGVGRDLMNRPKVEIAAHLRRGAVQPAAQRAIAQNCWRYSSGVEGARPHDMGLKFVNRTAWHALGRRVGAVSVGIYQPFSKGDVSLASHDPAVPPRVRFNLLADERDLDRLALGLGLACELLAEPEVAAVRNEVFMPDRRIAASLARRGDGAAARAAALAALLDIGPLRRAALGASTVDPAQLARDAMALAALAREHASLGWHVCGTCRMGGDGDPLAVVDARCRVRGVEGLRVVDASIFPTIAGEGGMQATVLMVAEKAADLIKADWRRASTPPPVLETTQ
jgi:5-(hydroxymethyl)furfural/furfural oxidase